MKIAKIDRLGRIVIPIEDRKALNLKEGSLVEISRENGVISITLHGACCKLCGAELDNTSDIYLCLDCIKAVKRL